MYVLHIHVDTKTQIAHYACVCPHGLLTRGEGGLSARSAYITTSEVKIGCRILYRRRRRLDPDHSVVNSFCLIIEVILFRSLRNQFKQFNKLSLLGGPGGAGGPGGFWSLGDGWKRKRRDFIFLHPKLQKKKRKKKKNPVLLHQIIPPIPHLYHFIHLFN